MPTTAFLQFVCARRFLSPIAWISSISLQRCSISDLFPGTNGVRGYFLVSTVSEMSQNSNPITIYPDSAGDFILKVVIRLLSLASLPRSISLITIWLLNRSDSASTIPFSAIILWPEKTRSVEDSPSPASA